MNLSSLTAISPIDGRYRAQVAALAPYFSEAALIQYRVRVEVEYLLMLADKGITQLPPAVKEIERTTKHDVKAVEYFLKDRIKGLSGEEITEWIHFGLTSQDINNT